jgi:hypothetical protein
VPEYFEGISVVPARAGIRSKPDESLLVLKDNIDVVI